MTYSSDFTPNVTEFDVEIYTIALELDVEPDKAWEFAVEVCEVDKDDSEE